MSTIIMSACWPLQGMNASQKAVLISLADNANDSGVCWPSIRYISTRTCLSERAVQGAIKWLVEAGALKVSERRGRSTVYTVTPAEYAPQQDMRGANNVNTPADAAPAPADAAPRTVKNHQGTINNPLTPLAGGGSPVAEKPKPSRKPRIQLKTFIENCKQSDEKPISGYQPLLDYVEATGLPMEFVQLAWEVFKDEFLPGGSNESRLQADWRRHFLNYVKKGYYRLWYAKQGDSEGATVYMLSTQGLQAQAAVARREAA